MIKLYMKESKYNLDWKEVGTETLYIDDDKLRLPIYEKRPFNKVVIQVVPEDDNNELVWTVYYTSEIGMAGFKFVETGFFKSGEAMDFVDNEFIPKLSMDEDYLAETSVCNSSIDKIVATLKDIRSAEPEEYKYRVWYYSGNNGRLQMQAYKWFNDQLTKRGCTPVYLNDFNDAMHQVYNSNLNK